MIMLTSDDGSPVPGVSAAEFPQSAGQTHCVQGPGLVTCLTCPRVSPLPGSGHVTRGSGRHVGRALGVTSVPGGHVARGAGAGALLVTHVML